MNIKEAKEQIKNAMSAYFTRDEFASTAKRPFYSAFAGAAALEPDPSRPGGRCAVAGRPLV